MVIDVSRSSITISSEYPVLSTVTANIEEGAALILVPQTGNPQNAVKLSDGSSSAEIFVGLAWQAYTLPTVMTQVDTVVVPSASPYTATLSYTPNSASTLTSASGSVTGALTYTSPPNSTGQYAISGTTITFNSAQAGETVTVYYQYNLTVAQAQSLVGNGFAGSVSAMQFLQSIGVVRNGLIYTNFYNPAYDFTAANLVLKALANGLIGTTVGSPTGATMTGAWVYAYPNGDYPYLGVQLTA